MADVKISDLAADSSPESTALIEIETAGGLSRKITLAQVLEVGDTASPGASKVYGTDASGVRGWYDAPSGASPGGSGSELQYRSGASSFGGASGTHWDAANGRLSIGAGTSPAGMVHAQSSAASVITGVIQGAASQTAVLSEWRTSAGTAVASVDVAGTVRSASHRDYSSASSGRLAFPSGYTSLYGYDNKHALAIGSTTGIVNLPYALALGPNYFTNDILISRLDAGVMRLRGTSDSVGAALNIRELDADPSDPPEGTFTLWMSNGTGAGDDGDIMAKITAGGVTKTATLIDYSAW